MCMIALRPTTEGRGSNMPNNVIDTAMSRHPDGFGVMWRENGALYTRAFGPGERKAFRKALKAVDKGGHEYAAHFRFATSGPKDSTMAHPYTYDDPDPAVGKVALMHNGVIDIKHDHAVESDTHAFVRLVLTRLPSRWWANPALEFLVGEAIGWSKFVIMTKDETVNLHDSRGDWDSGLWYSSDHTPTRKWQGKSIGRNYDEDYSNEYGSWDAATKRWTPSGTWNDKTRKWEYNSGKGKGDATTNASLTAALVIEADRRLLTPTTAVASAYKGKARSAAVTLGLLTAGEESIATATRVTQFRHAGHALTAVKDVVLDMGDADYEDAVICDTCRTIGSVYVIDGMYYIDMGHMYGSDMRDEDDDALLMAAETDGGDTFTEATILGVATS